MTRRTQQYPPELRERAVRMVAEVTPSSDSKWAVIGAVAQKLGVGTAETVRFIAEHADCSDGGLRWGVEPICAVLSDHGCPIAPPPTTTPTPALTVPLRGSSGTRS